MSGIEEKAVADAPVRIVRVEVEEFGIQYMNKIGTAHGAPGMPRSGFFNHSSRQYPDVVGSPFVNVVHYSDKVLRFGNIQNYKKAKVSNSTISYEVLFLLTTRS